VEREPVTPLELAADILKNGRYRDAQQPFGIGSTSFSFDAVLTTDKSLDLVILQDTTLGSPDRMRREILCFGRSLDVIGSRRTLTLVLIGQRLDENLLESVSQVCRVLSVGPEANEKQLREWLAVLLPLKLPKATDLQGDWSSDVRDRLTGDVARIATAYLNAAEQGEAGVSHELRRRIDRVLAGVLSWHVSSPNSSSATFAASRARSRSRSMRGSCLFMAPTAPVRRASHLRLNSR
jgi:hypothetical protein